ncbi:MAG: hypothetical protein V4622_10810 [Bacteroidota bacterium]
MKKTILLLFATVFSLSLGISQTNSNLVVFSEDGNPFYVIVNGIKQNVEPRTNLKITGLTNPSNHVRIIFKNESIPSLDKSIFFQEMGVEATMKITRTKKKGYKLRYFGEIPLNQAPVDNNQWIETYSTSEVSSTNTNNTNTNVVTNTNNTNVTTNTDEVKTEMTTGNVEMNGQNGTNNTVNSTTVVTTNNSMSNLTSAELNYIWVSGSAHHFSAVEVDNITTSMMGMNMTEQIKTTTDFVLLIKNVAANGYATGTLYLVNFRVTDSQNNVLASINDIPKSAIQGEVSVDKKGHFTFLKKVFLITSGSTNVLAYGSATDNSVQVGGQAGDMKVDAYAEFNPKTGALKAGYNVQEIKTTKKVSVKLDEETQMIDVFPYEFLELLALPEGVIAQGDKMSVKSGMYTMDITANSLQNGIAQLNTTLTTDKSADMFGGEAKGNQGGSEIDMNMNMGGIDGMGDMELTEDDKNAMGMAKSMSPDMTCNINSSFNYSEGMFQSVSGTVNTNMDAMGMKMTVQSVLEMKKM